ncbi:hypothetical protein SRO_6537 [Streptomyces rochei]|nr:hypothetical protein SRO_6537 [Streptomyces rochei]
MGRADGGEIAQLSYGIVSVFHKHRAPFHREANPTGRTVEVRLTGSSDYLFEPRPQRCGRLKQAGEREDDDGKHKAGGGAGRIC